MVDFTKQDIKYIADHLHVKQPSCILVYINSIVILILLYILYILYVHTKSLKKYNNKLAETINKLNNVENLLKKKERFKSSDSDPRYLVSRSEKNTDNNNLMESAGLEFYSNPYLEDSRLIDALNDL
jgi:hypothetical protein